VVAIAMLGVIYSLSFLKIFTLPSPFYTLTISVLMEKQQDLAILLF
jgi:hypothetical protein